MSQCLFTQQSSLKCNIFKQKPFINFESSICAWLSWTFQVWVRQDKELNVSVELSNCSSTSFTCYRVPLSWSLSFPSQLAFNCRNYKRFLSLLEMSRSKSGIQSLFKTKIKTYKPPGLHQCWLLENFDRSHRQVLGTIACFKFSCNKMGKLVRPLQSRVLHSPIFKVDTVKHIKAMLWSASDISRFQAVLQIGAWSKHEELLLRMCGCSVRVLLYLYIRHHQF